MIEKKQKTTTFRGGENSTTLLFLQSYHKILHADVKVKNYKWTTCYSSCSSDTNTWKEKLNHQDVFSSVISDLNKVKTLV